MKPFWNVIAAAAAASLLLAGCSSGTDSEAQTDSGGADASVTGLYLASDCAVPGPPTEVADPPAGATAPGVVAADGAEGVPMVYVAADAAPAAELQVVDIRPGNGPSAALGDNVTVNYCGVGLSSGTLFDSSWARGAPATFPLVEGGLIEGWVQGVPGMQLGEQVLLVIPGALAYGANPPPGIEPDETLVFVVELLDINGEG